jgi:GNAT superfamily N-acetyltransferase
MADAASVDIRPLERREIGRAAGLLADAFAADPFIGYFLRDATRRRLAFPRFFASVLHDLIDLGGSYAAEMGPSLAGVAVWAPPAPGCAQARSRLRAHAHRTLVRALFPRATERMLVAFRTLGEHHPDQPHWYLAFIGIEPGLQRTGIGSSLLAPVLGLADRDRTACYLETPFPATRSFYERLGFEPTAELRPDGDAPPVWSMTRPA